jgi:hypothetical protein
LSRPPGSFKTGSLPGWWRLQAIFSKKIILYVTVNINCKFGRNMLKIQCFVAFFNGVKRVNIATATGLYIFKSSGFYYISQMLVISVCRNGTEISSYGHGLYSSELEAARAEEVIRYVYRTPHGARFCIRKGSKKTRGRFDDVMKSARLCTCIILRRPGPTKVSPLTSQKEANHMQNFAEFLFEISSSS